MSTIWRRCGVSAILAPSINQFHFIYPTVQQHKKEYQQNNVKHSDGLPEKQIPI